jgi:hypothetical protein
MPWWVAFAGWVTKHPELVLREPRPEDRDSGSEDCVVQGCPPASGCGGRALMLRVEGVHCVNGFEQRE